MRSSLVFTMIAASWLFACNGGNSKPGGTGGQGGQGSPGGTTGSSTGGKSSPGGGSSSSTSGGAGVGGSSAGGPAGSGGSAAGGSNSTTTSQGGAKGGSGSGGAPITGGTGQGGTNTGGNSGSGGTTGTSTVGGIQIAVGDKTLDIELCAANVVRVAVAKSPTFFARESLMIATPKKCKYTADRVVSSPTQIEITTPKLTVRADPTTGAVSFLDPAGKTILAESGRTLTAATVQGEATTSVRQEWQPNDDESLYGLGQHQHGLLNIKGTDLDLHQYNTKVFIPYLVSSRGYGILWDNTSYSRFGDLTNAVPLPGTTGLYASSGESGDVNASSGKVDWSGSITPTATGDYTFRTYSSGAIQLQVNGKTVIDHWRQGWLPSEDLAHVKLTAGQATTVRLQWTADSDVDILRLLYKPPVSTPTTSLWSQVADGIDYYFVYGPELDDVVAGYRDLTGQAPMMPLWAYGFWQCRERYKTAQEITDVLKGYRDRKAPIDNIVQDWQFWKEDQWGSHQFDPSRYPDPAGMIKTIHDTYHARLMVSVWPKFYSTTANYKALNDKGYVYKLNITEGKKDFVRYVFTFYDAFNSDARAMYWSQMNTELFSKGVDAWWMDATEPEIVEGPFTSIASQINTNQTHMNPTALGSGAKMLNAFALVNSQAVYEGQRVAAPNQRVFMLTRNGFAGMQRYSAATWSGDITSTWTAMRKQIPAGMGFSISGMPYWTLDSGGFAVQTKYSATTPTAADTDEWRELNTRWFEYATFLPLMRVHGQTPFREMWQFGGDTSTAYQAMLKFDRLRYRMLPYVYSLAGGVTQRSGTILRPLVMDFRTDTSARDIVDQYMFGPAFLVAPVTTYKATTRSVYLPTTPGGWYLFWTGAAAAGGATVSAPAPFDAMPVYVRAGSIVPFGPDLQYTGEKPADPITLYVYAGADGAFTLYEDQGTTNDYEKDAFSEIPLQWNDASKTLKIGDRKGTFTGMLASRTFQVVRIASGKAVGFPSTADPDKTVTYTGAAVDVPLN